MCIYYFICILCDNGSPAEGHDDGQGLEHTMYKERLADQASLVQQMERMGRSYNSEGNYNWIKENILSQ